MTRANRAVRLSPLAFALAFGAYSENFTAGRGETTAPNALESVALTTEGRKILPDDGTEA